jgi:hypothetical protein
MNFGGKAPYLGSAPAPSRSLSRGSTRLGILSAERVREIGKRAGGHSEHCGLKKIGFSLI